MNCLVPAPLAEVVRGNPVAAINRSDPTVELPERETRHRLWLNRVSKLPGPPSGRTTCVCSLTRRAPPNLHNTLLLS